jgi:hypothetical protein
VTKKLVPEEALADVKRCLLLPQWQRKANPTAWFFPSDIVNHSSSFKYKCEKLYKAGLLERNGSPDDRWGFQYRVKGE